MRKKAIISYIPYGCSTLLGAVAALAPRVLHPEDTRDLAVCLVVLGILSFLTRPRAVIGLIRMCTLADAIALLAAGIAIFPRYRFVRTVFPVVTGAMFLTLGVTALNVSRYLGQCGDRKWLLFALLSILVIAAAFYLLLALFLKTDPAIRTFGNLLLGTSLLKILLLRQVHSL